MSLKFIKNTRYIYCKIIFKKVLIHKFYERILYMLLKNLKILRKNTKNSD